MEEIQKENELLQAVIREAQLQLTQLRDEKNQIQKCYDKAIQEVADSEAKREIAEKELRLAHDQIANMWKELENLRMMVDESKQSLPTNDQTTINPISTESSLMILCTLCHEKVNLNKTHSTNHSKHNDSCTEQSPQSSPQNHTQKQQKSRHWLFGKKQSRVQELDSHSKSCHSVPSSPSRSRNANSCSPSSSPTARRRVLRARATESPAKMGAGKGEEYLVVNVTRSSHAITEMSPFKIVTKTNRHSFPALTQEVYRSQGDFQWLYSALQEACPDRIVPPLRPPISLDATISEFQRFLSRVAAHKNLSTHHLFVVFLSGNTEELRALRVKHRPHCHGDTMRYKPAMGRDTNSGPLVDTKDYLTMLEQNIVGLTSHLEHSSRRGHGSIMERSAHWFSAISDSEPNHTYLKRASADLARTCEGMESQLGNSDEMLFTQNLQSLADYIRVAQDLLTRVEEAVDQYLYWEEEVTIIEAVNSSPKAEHTPPCETPGDLQDTVTDDSGVSDVTSSSAGDREEEEEEGTTHSGGHVMQEQSRDLADTRSSSSERWAHASKKCADAKDHLEMMCSDLAEELSFFDLQKEKEVKQILLDYATSQLERHEKFQGKWFAMKFILDSPILTEKRAIQFSPTPATPTSPISTH